MKPSATYVLAAVSLVVALALYACPVWAGGQCIVSVDTDKAVYGLGETSIVLWTLENPGDELACVTCPVMYVFENAANLGRGDLLANQEPLDDWDLIVQPFGQVICVPAGEALGGSRYWCSTSSLGLGEYELVAVTWPYSDGTVIDYTNASAHITVVPEPGTLALVIVGALSAVIRRGKGSGSRG